VTDEPSRRILVVDDKPHNSALLEAQLTRAGYDVACVDNGCEALETATLERPDLILLDIMMPGMDGYQVLEQLKGREITKHIPVIVLTALQDRAEKLRALDLGASDFLTKPVDRAELLARVRTLLQLNDLWKAQGELIRMKDELLSVVSHELRTALASLVGFTELLLTQDYSEEQRREFLIVMMQEGRRLTALINDFLDLQRMESGRQTVHLQPIDLKPLLQQAITTLGEDPERPIVLDLPAELPQVDGDPDRLMQVFTNLLSNARKYSPHGGRIRVSAVLGGRGLRIRIEDRGLGIPKDALPKLFQKFYRVDNSDQRSITGTGLGLAICRQIIAEHGGRIGATSDGEGKGSTFWFTLAFSRPNPVSGDVLIVEDDVGFCRLLEAELAALGLSAVRTPNAEAAPDRLVTSTPKAIALDLLLPGMSGEEFLRALVHKTNDVLPVVVITVKDLDGAQRDQLRELGAVAFVPKGPEAAFQAAARLAESVVARTTQP
jgi:signal transduction histidine kinase